MGGDGCVPERPDWLRRAGEELNKPPRSPLSSVTLNAMTPRSLTWSLMIENMRTEMEAMARRQEEMNAEMARTRAELARRDVQMDVQAALAGSRNSGRPARSATKLVSAWRRQSAVQRLRCTLASVRLMQRMVRGGLVRRSFCAHLRAAIQLQSSARRMLQVLAWTKAVSACVHVQALCRRLVSRRLLQRAVRATVRLQAAQRCRAARLLLIESRCASGKIQENFRVYMRRIAALTKSALRRQIVREREVLRKAITSTLCLETLHLDVEPVARSCPREIIGISQAGRDRRLDI